MHSLSPSSCPVSSFLFYTFRSRRRRCAKLEKTCSIPLPCLFSPSLPEQSLFAFSRQAYDSAQRRRRVTGVPLIFLSRLPSPKHSPSFSSDLQPRPLFFRRITLIMGDHSDEPFLFPTVCPLRFLVRQLQRFPNRSIQGSPVHFLGLAAAAVIHFHMVLCPPYWRGDILDEPRPLPSSPLVFAVYMFPSPKHSVSNALSLPSSTTLWWPL